MALWNDIKNYMGFGGDDETETTSTTKTDSKGQTTTTVTDKEITPKVPSAEYVPTGVPTAYTPTIPQSVLDAQQKSRESQIIETLLPNVPPNGIPSAAYQPMQATPVIQGFTPGSPLPIFGSPNAVNFPYQLYDQRQRALLNAAIINEQKNIASQTPPTFKAPEAFLADQPKLNKEFLNTMNDISLEAAASNVDLSKELKNPASPWYRRVQQASEAFGQWAATSKSISAQAKRLIYDETGIVPSDLKSRISEMYHTEGFLSPEGYKIQKYLVQMPNYLDMLKDTSSELAKMPDVTGVSDEEIAAFENTAEAKRIKGGKSEIARYLVSKKFVDSGRAADVAESMMAGNLTMFSVTKPQFFDKNGNLADAEGLKKDIAKDLTSRLGEQYDIGHNVLSYPTQVNVNTGTEKIKHKVYVPDYNSFLKDESNVAGKDNMTYLLDQVNTAFMKYGAANNLDGVNGWMTNVGKSLKNNQGKQFIGNFVSVKSKDQPLEFDLFGGAAPPIDKDYTQSFTPNDVLGYIRQSGTTIDEKGQVKLNDDAYKRWEELSSTMKVLKDEKGNLVRTDKPMVYKPKNMKAAFVDIHGNPISTQALNYLKRNGREDEIRPAMAVTMEFAPTLNNMKLSGNADKITKTLEFTMYVPIDTEGSQSSIQTMLQQKEYSESAKYPSNAY